MMFVWWLVTLAMACFVYIACYLGFEEVTGEGGPLHKWRTERFDRWWGLEGSLAPELARVAILMPFVLVFFSPIYYDFPSTAHPLVTFEGDGGIRVYPYGRFAWPGSAFRLPTESWAIPAEVSPITENPKVRRIHYTVSARMTSPELFYRTEERRRLGGYAILAAGKPVSPAAKEIWQLAAFWTYEFNDGNSAALARFSNPFDPAQQAAFKELVKGWLQEKVAEDGITITVSSFSLL